MASSTYPSESGGITDWSGSVGRAVRTDGCVFLLCTRGRAVVAANLQRTVFRCGDLLVLTSDVYFSVAEVSSGFSARYVSLSESMIETAYYKISSMALWDYLHYAPVLRLSPEQRKLMAEWLDQMDWILANIAGTRRTALLNNNAYNLFVAIDTELARSAGEAAPGRKDRAWAITCRFWSLLTRHASRERSVRFYAEALHITPDYLNKVCRRAYGMSSKSLIDQQIVVEMKALLTDTQLSVAEIADRLRFEDASYLCRFFRRMTGCSPLAFRSGAPEHVCPGAVGVRKVRTRRPRQNT